MAKLTKSNLFKMTTPRAETPMDKTTRAVQDILDEEKKHRQFKTERLRKARLEREASPAAKIIEPTTKKPRKKPHSRANPDAPPHLLQ
ncbi:MULTISPECIES: hypothetical protein [unclassified Marinovum]